MTSLLPGGRLPTQLKQDVGLGESCPLSVKGQCRPWQPAACGMCNSHRLATSDKHWQSGMHFIESKWWSLTWMNVKPGLMAEVFHTPGGDDVIVDALDLLQRTHMTAC